ncbi:hypothetical protein ABZX98_16890 [Streptomyces sp. NPDC002992]|uniref:hypothetical protein n=1 Tax=Streptomyces sp. NPDC002992 TaxID=3154273 RepID=UPI0033BF5E42
MLADVDESGALAFAEVVTAAFLDSPAPDGAALVTTSAPRAPEPRRTRRPGIAAALAALLPWKSRTREEPRG